MQKHREVLAHLLKAFVPEHFGAAVADQPVTFMHR